MTACIIVWAMSCEIIFVVVGVTRMQPVTRAELGHISSFWNGRGVLHVLWVNKFELNHVRLDTRTSLSFPNAPSIPNYKIFWYF